MAECIKTFRQRLPSGQLPSDGSSHFVLCFISIFPLLIFLISVLGNFLRSDDFRNKLIDLIVQFIPISGSQDDNLIISVLHEISSSSNDAIGIIGLLAMAWSATGMFGVVRNSVNIAYHLEKSRPFFMQKTIDLAMVLVVGIFFLFSIAVTAIVRILQGLSSKWIMALSVPYLDMFIGEHGLAWRMLSYLIPFLLSCIGFYIIYWIIPAVRFPFRSLWPGVLFASVLFEAGKVVFVFYIQHFAKYELIFGSLGTVIAFLFWVYISAMILLFGAEIASEYSRTIVLEKSTVNSTLPDD
ncbi:YihY/virulence factor BrkB family protein [bacterium]|nr:YihY/virulence factor BrkB family protein [bacterium]